MELVLIVVIVAVLLLGVAAATLLRRRTGFDDVDASGAVAPPAPAAPPRTLADRLARTRDAVGDRLADIFGRGRLDAQFWSELEETLIAADVGVGPATAIVERVRASRPADIEEAKRALRGELLHVLGGRDRTLSGTGNPMVLVVVGVNGTGKTTSIAKLAHRFVGAGERVVLGAADTFRAGAAEQLATWADRVGADIVSGEANSDPAAVAYRTLERAKETGADVVIIDTAGRLHSNRNLMEELEKINRVLTREADVDEALLVLDATTGQNAIPQARTFTNAVGVSGIILTKLDGTARGGVVVAIEEELDLPVKLIGVGEGMEDLVGFEPEAFVDALLGG